MNFERLEKNICDNIYEAQLKLGYDRLPMSLNYTAASLCHLIGIGSNITELTKLLTEFSEEVLPRLGRLNFTEIKEGFCITVPAQGTAYVHGQAQGREFMAALVETVRAHGDAEKVLALFREAAPDVSITELDNGEFRYLAYFPDKAPDEYYYCIAEEEEIDGSLHASYHRFIREDYEELGF